MSTEPRWRDPHEEFARATVAEAMRDASLLDRETTKHDADGSAIAQWPEPLAPEAYHGLAGDIVRTLEPHSEADPAALLIQLLVGFGNVAGRVPHFMAEADRHGLNLFAVLVGPTAKARKGASWSHVRRLLSEVDETWASQNVKSGLASGEGLIWHIRDEIREPQPIKEKGIIKRFEVITTDPGVTDKRLLIVEPEFGRVLQVCERQANTLSAVIRQAWDGDTLSTLTKKQAAKASEPHVSVIGHITADELRRLLTDTLSGNGFGNRFLWVCARRSKLLPNGGSVDPAALGESVRRSREAVDHARCCEELRRDSEADAVWSEVYGPLSEGKPGLVGSLTSRAEAQAMRLALLYALLDGADEIRAEHLSAALAVWSYCERSARFVFGDSLGDQTADTILAALRQSPAGLTRAEMSGLFSRHKSAGQIAAALSALTRAGLARCEREKTGGRSSERWFSLIAKKAKYAK